MNLRPALLADAPDIQSIYAHHVLNSTGTFDEVPPSVEEFEAQGVVCTGLFDDNRETPEDYRERLCDMRSRGRFMACANPDVVVERDIRLAAPRRPALTGEAVAQPAQAPRPRPPQPVQPALVPTRPAPPPQPAPPDARCPCLDVVVARVQ